MNKSGLLPIETAVQQNLHFHFKNLDGIRFVIGVSGGMDSMALLHIFKRLNISAYVVHINYQKRGVASDKDADLVAGVCRKWNFEYTIFEVDPSKASGHNFQQWARNQRYQLFEKVMELQQADGIAIAHHRDDQIETVIQKIFRGAGLASWSGMQVWNGTLFRPLLDVSRNKISGYVEENSIPYRTDTSNLESDFARNFLRNEWLAELAGFFPGWEQNVLQITEQAKCFDQSLSWISDRITSVKGINREEFHTLSLKVQKAIILHCLKKKNPNVEVTKHALNQLDDLQKLQTGKEVQLTDRFYLLRDRDYYLVTEDRQESFISIKLHKEDVEQSAYITDTLDFSVEDCDALPQKNGLYLDLAKIHWPITLRRWQQGDRLQPLGMKGHQLVSDHLTNRKISATHKHKALVIESFEERICAVIFPPIKNSASIGTISEQVKWDAGTKQCIKITYSKKR